MPIFFFHQRLSWGTQTTHTVFWKALWTVLYLLPIAAVFFLISRWGVNVIFGDELHFIRPVAMLYGDEPWRWSVLLQQLNEHRPVFPILLIALLAFFTDWNIKTELFVSPLLALLNVYLLHRLANHSLGKKTTFTRLLLGLVVVALSFSLTQWENWYQSICLAFFMVVTFFLTAVWVVSRSTRRWKDVLLAALLCFMASFSLIQGLLAWLALIPLLLWDSSGEAVRQRRAKLAFWAIAFATTSLLFAYHHQPPTIYGYDLDSPLRLLGYFAAFLGAPVSLYLPAAIIAGAVMVLLTGVIFHKVWRLPLSFGPYVPWLCLLSFAVLSAGVHAIGRLEFGIYTALNSRYLTTSTVGVIALLYATYHYLQHSPVKYWRAFQIALLGILFSTVVGGLLSLDHWEGRIAALKQGQACLRVHTIAAVGCLGLAFTGGVDMKAHAATLDRLGFLPAFVLPPDLNWQTATDPSRGIVHYRIQPVYVASSGWAIEENCSPARHIIVTYGATRQLVGYTTAVLAPEEVPPFHPACHHRAGWRVVIDRSQLPASVDATQLTAWVYQEKSKTARRLITVP